MKKLLAVFLFVVGVIVLTSCASTRETKFPSKKDVYGVRGKLIYHPDKRVIDGKDSKKYYLFYDFQNRTLFVSDNDTLYQKFATFLPEQVIPGREITLEGPTINPLTFFDKNQLATESRKIGINLNEFKVASLFNWGLITNQLITDQWQQGTAPKKETKPYQF